MKDTTNSGIFQRLFACFALVFHKEQMKENIIQESMNPKPIILRANLFKKQEIDKSVFCSICFQTEEEVFHCSGPCSSYFCVACIIQQRTSNCPRKCSPYSKLFPFKNKFQYYCPYNRSCPYQIQSIEDFNKHSKQCSYITQWAANWFETQSQYQCTEKHPLIFVNDNNYRQIFARGSHFNMAINETCTFCREASLCKSACLICKGDKDRAVFCIKCRPVPCTSEKCPIGHDLEFSRGFGDQMTCDFCGIIAKNQGGIIYGDRECNFDICEVCHSKARKDHPLVPLPNIIPEELKANIIR